MNNNFLHPTEQSGQVPPRSPSERSSFSTQPSTRALAYPHPSGRQTPVPRQPPHPSHIDLAHFQQQPIRQLPQSSLHQTQSVNMSHIPLHVLGGPTDTSQPPRKKAKIDLTAMPNHNPQSPKPQSAAKPSAPAYPIIDIIPAGPRGDTIIKLSLAQNGPGHPSAAQPKKTILLRVHSLLLMLHSPFFRDLFSAQAAGGVNAHMVYTEASPWTLPSDWDGAAFLDWCVMVCGMSSVYDVVGDNERSAHGAKQQGPIPKTEDGSGDRVPKKSTKGTDGGRMGRFPRVVALAENLGCAKAMKQHCGMPLWRFFGPNGEADEDGLKAKGLDILDAVAIAYVVDDETLFRRATEYALVCLGKEQWDHDIRGGLDSILPKTLIGDIKTKRRATLSALEKAAYKSVTAIHGKVTSLEPCNGAMEKLATYTLQMCHVKDGAYDLAATGMSLGDVWEGLEAAVESLPETTKKCSKTCEGGCAVDMRDILIKAIEQNKETVDGLCLRCVKECVQANDDGEVQCGHELED